MSRIPSIITTTIASFRSALTRMDAEDSAIDWAAEWERGVSEPERVQRMAEAIETVTAAGGKPYPGPVAVALRGIVQGGTP